MSRKTVYEKGTTVRVRVTYTDASSGALADPAGGVTLKARKPGGTVTNITTENPSVGVWEGLIPTDEEGTWHYRFTASQPSRVDTGTFDVKLDPEF